MVSPEINKALCQTALHTTESRGKTAGESNCSIESVLQGRATGKLEQGTGDAETGG